MSEILNKRLSLLGIADMDYLSARLQLLCGLTCTGSSKACEAFEKILKLFIILEAKITKNQELDGKFLKGFEHKLVKLFEYAKTKIPASFDDTWVQYFSELENAYKTRYPEGWKNFKLTNDFEWLDKAYCYLRNSIVLNFPPEESDKAKEFGTFIYGAYTAEIKDKIKKLGVLTPKDIFLKNNDSAKDFNINLDKL